MMLMVLAAWLVSAGAAFIHASSDDSEVKTKFSAFIQEHARTYTEGSDEYHSRLALFKERLAEVEAHNGQSDRTWSAAVNKLADYTPEELAQLRGYRHQTKEAAGSGSVGLASMASRVVDTSHLPTDFSWRGKLKSMSEVINQGGCGSCWAVSSAAALRAHSELYQVDRTFSAQQILECTPNPKSCGGTGGCKGATAELAMDYVAKNGAVMDSDFGYTAKESACPENMQPVMQSVASDDTQGVSFPSVAVHTEGGGGAGLGMVGWQKLPENKAEALLVALYEKGPVVVSVAAGAGWNMYNNGVIKACTADNPVINHAVVLVGYGKDGNDKYWQIQNSWGPDWGEGGFIRLVREDSHTEDAYCGWDQSPEEGTACKGGPSKVWVCGQCGILYDSVVPNFALSPNGWLSKNGHNSPNILAQTNSSFLAASLRR